MIAVAGTILQRHINVNVKQYSSTKVLRGVCVKRCVFNPGLNCPQPMDDEQSCDGSAFQTVGAQTPSVVNTEQLHSVTSTNVT